MEETPRIARENDTQSGISGKLQLKSTPQIFFIAHRLYPHTSVQIFNFSRRHNINQPRSHIRINIVLRIKLFGFLSFHIHCLIEVKKIIRHFPNSKLSMN